jgi:large subunit ribosomal protein L21
MEYAVFASGGKQYKVQIGDIVELEKLEGAEGDSLTFDDVLLHAVNDSVVVGQPTVAGVSITATIIGQIKGNKIRVAKFKAKARYRKVQGHRQHLTQVKIEKIAAKTSKAKKEDSEK